MTDNEIIKALECCYAKGKNCNDCPTNDFECTNIEKMALDLINRQKAEILRLQNKVEILEMEKQMSKEDSDKSKAAAMGVIKRQDAEIERLKQENFDRSLTVETWKCEAVKEFAERLKEQMCQENELYKSCAKGLLPKDYQQGYEEKNDNVIRLIDNLVKEMVGEG